MPTVIGEEIKRLRTRQAFTQKEFAAKCGVSAEVMCRWESGKLVPSLRSIRKMAKVLKIKPEELTELL